MWDIVIKASMGGFWRDFPIPFDTNVEEREMGEGFDKDESSFPICIRLALQG
jgi:hypothetical protein